ncbi:glycine zipper 2TM domain-containing protein [Sphingomonas sp. MG17]|uniref:17 kDa surface antigen n=1 Tax=Sphingomonas tagetis TaxID=2949092 RepID=A0A9X2HCZ9_9SPHN|nr:glycine zipper 2TM domain-containing protein [Sphingomonas tagetis]MCP3728836.1 glycine zipper 2TM domain-containing protein [Sphingomonas tagetis]
MRNLMMALGAASLAVPATAMLPSLGGPSFGTEAQAQSGKRYRYREWRGRDGRRYCRRSDGTTGLVVGAVGGALVGRAIDTGGDRTVGTLLGAAAGAVAGREIERSSSRRRCR